MIQKLQINRQFIKWCKLIAMESVTFGAVLLTFLHISSADLSVRQALWVWIYSHLGLVALFFKSWGTESFYYMFILIVITGVMGVAIISPLLSERKVILIISGFAFILWLATGFFCLAMGI